MLSIAGWRGVCGTGQSCQALALCHQQWALVLSGKLKQNKTCIRVKDRGGTLSTTEMLIETSFGSIPGL
jgi:hypothetical protein